MNKDVITQIQKLLTTIGYPLTPDGIWGKLSQAALDAACKAHGVGISKPETTTSAATDNSVGDFWDDIEYFTEREFICPCGRCGGLPVRPVEKLIRTADRVRAQAGRPAHVSSGVRCAAHNAELSGSAANSRHLKGWAMDFCIEGMSSTQLLTLVQAQPEVAYSYKIDGSFVHMDVIP